MVLLAVMAMACSQTQSAATNSITPSPSTCRLPIAIPDSSGHMQGAFVDYVSGRMTVDPGGVGGAYYDRAYSRWLPVNQNAVSSDGSRFVYLDPKVPGTSARQQLHLVDLPTGSEKLYELAPTGDPAGYVVVSVATEGIWLSFSGYEGPRGGLFLLDLTTGQLKNVGGQRMIFDPVAGGPGIFWFTEPGPNPTMSGIGFYMPDRVKRFTIVDGKAEDWFIKDGSYLTVLGTDLAGHPILTDSTEVWLASSPDASTVIAVPPGYYHAFTDEHGIWFGGDQGIYLYAATGVQKVSDQKGAPAGTCA